MTEDTLPGTRISHFWPDPDCFEVYRGESETHALDSVTFLVTRPSPSHVIEAKSQLASAYLQASLGGMFVNQQCVAIVGVGSYPASTRWVAGHWPTSAHLGVQVLFDHVDRDRLNELGKNIAAETQRVFALHDRPGVLIAPLAEQDGPLFEIALTVDVGAHFDARDFARKTLQVNQTFASMTDARELNLIRLVVDPS